MWLDVLASNIAHANQYFAGSELSYSKKVWQGESLANLANRLRFAKLKPSKLIVTIDNPMSDLFICQTFFRQTFENSRFTKHSACQTFPLYGTTTINLLLTAANLLLTCH